MPRPDSWRLRIALLREEFGEYVEAAEAGDLVAVADALADMTYVIYGTAYEVVKGRVRSTGDRPDPA